MLLAAAVLWALVAPDPDAVAVVPLRVEGELDANARAELDESLREGLKRADFVVLEARPKLPSKCDATCLDAARTEAGAAHIVRARVTVAAKIYRIHLDLIGEGGETVVTTDEACEVCGRSVVAELMASQGATARRRLELSKQEAREAGGGRSDPDPPPAKVAPTPEPKTETKFLDAPRDPYRTWGGVTLGAGIASLGAGIALLVLHARPYRARCTGNDVDFAGRCRLEYDTLAGGITATILGTGLVATGIGLLVRARRNRLARNKAQATGQRP